MTAPDPDPDEDEFDYDIREEANVITNEVTGELVWVCPDCSFRGTRARLNYDDWSIRCPECDGIISAPIADILADYITDRIDADVDHDVASAAIDDKLDLDQLDPHDPDPSQLDLGTSEDGDGDGDGDGDTDSGAGGDGA